MQRQEYKKIILVDLDGVLNNYKGDFNQNYIPSPKEGALEFIKKLSIKYKVYLFTTRNLLLASEWIIKHGFKNYIYEVTQIKHPAYLYIDDRTICFNGSFQQLEEQIESFQTYWNVNPENQDQNNKV